jgi:hypothetical protein
LHMTRSHTCGIVLALLLLRLSATAESVLAPLPPEVSINKEAGRGGHLIVTLRLESGEELPCIVDTGSSGTLLDKSLEPKLGKRIGPLTIWSDFGQQESGIYAAPLLYLGNVPLKTYHQVFTYDFKKVPAFSRAGVRGILGMDCLQHYCVQLDFEEGRMRFLGPEQVKRAELGKAFPLTYSVTAAKKNVPSMSLLFIPATGFFGTKTNVMIDSGDNSDGAFEKGSISGHYLTRLAHFFIRSRSLRVKKCVWDGHTYTKLRVSPGENTFGLRFLARHLVTFDFPSRTMYLKEPRSGPLGSSRFEN